MSATIIKKSGPHQIINKIILTNHTILSNLVHNA